MTEHGFAVEEIERRLTGYYERNLESMSEEEQSYSRERIRAFNSLGDDVLFPVYSELLSANMDNPKYVNYILGGFVTKDGSNLASYGNPEALRLTREVVSKGEDIPEWALLYLTIKGNGDDVKLIEKAKVKISECDRQEFVDALRERVDGNFIRGRNRIPRQLQGEWGILPSVANTGPQGAYLRHIFEKLWSMREHWGDSMCPTIPEELITMVITFDKDGTPVSNVDLAKYGLSMPVITPKPDKHHYVSNKYDYTVTFPHETEATAPTPPQVTEPVPDIEATPPTDTTQEDISLSEQPQTPPKNKIPLWLGILALLAIVGMAVWKQTKRKR